MWLFFVLLVPSGVLGSTASAASIPTPTEASAVKLTFQYDGEPAKYSDLSKIPEDVLSLTCNDLNKHASIAFVDSMEPRSKKISGSKVTIDGPNKKASLVKDHTLETPTEFHSECPGDLTKCPDGFTIAFWFSYVANVSEWAENWPPTQECNLVSINNNIVIISETKNSDNPENQIHIDLKTNGQTNKRLTLSSSTTDTMKPHVKVCEEQRPGTNCSKGSPLQEEVKSVGWQWNHAALSVKKGETGTQYVLRAYYNGNPLDENNITLEDLSQASFWDGKGILLNRMMENDLCNHIGIDEIAVWKQFLSEENMTKVRIANFCEEKTTEPPEASVDQLGLNTEALNISAEAAKDPKVVKEAATAINDAIQDVLEHGNVNKEDVANLIGDLSDTVSTLADNSALFASDASTEEKKEAAENVATAGGSVLELAGKTDIPPEKKKEVAAQVVESVQALAESVMESDADVSITTDSISIVTQTLAADAETLEIKTDGANVIVAVPKSALDGETRVAVTVISYESIKDLISTVVDTITTETASSSATEAKLGGNLLSISVPNYEKGKLFEEPITFDILVVITEEEQGDRKEANCAYWDEDTGTFKTDGVQKTEYKNNIVKCEAFHLTNFAVLMAVTDLTISPIHAETLSTLTIVCTSISLVALFIAILILFIFRELSGTRISILKHLCIAMFIAQLVFITAIEKAAYNRKLCLVIAVFIHYLWLSVFFWMLAQGLFLYMKLRVAVRSDANIVWFCLIGWGFPAVMVTVTAGINIKAYGRDDLCWLNLNNGGAWAFVGPVLGVVMINCVVIVMAMKAFTSVKSFKDKADKDKFRSTLKAMIVMLPILGLSWIFGIFANIPGAGVAFSYIFSICNGLQGFFLFVFHIVFNAEVQRVVKRALLKRSSSVGAGEEPSFFRKMLGGDTEVTQTSQFSKSSSM